ncbi:MULTISPECIES: helix-turn-helix domain-containing protein [Streptomyces]|uniref:helix-turn-helix domain-containing protein n=1 Tax=Streptomyces TaxID=1883 RepID=UPI000A1DBEBE|nr:MULTISPECIES: helix-turn-helix domain-containing protein [Streptomyces]MCE3030702.1 helix-turn-helix domain-containing protein [Streptomyces sp. CMSTAAHL-2]WDO08660.1 helix-turn-helix domain-containing protein [Streptomyces murinus]WUD06910.1 helix-turn-helix domain-containing protein [Streptomyces murinus]
MQPSTNPSLAPLRVDDPKVMRALAHPARLAIMARLTEVGPGTATECASATGLSPSATSWHLRALAESGLIEEAEHPDKRKHLWRARSSQLVVANSERDGGAASRDLLRQYLSRSDRQLEEWLDAEAEQPAEWREALSIVNARVEVRPEELDELLLQVKALFQAYSDRARDGAEEGRRPVAVSLRAVPEVLPEG